MTDLTPNDLSHLSDEECNALCPQGEHAPGAEPLSPQAQAVLDAFENASDGEYVEGVWVVNERTMLAAALRAAADHVIPELQEPDWGACDYMHCDIELYTDHQRKRFAFLAIADELESHQ